MGFLGRALSATAICVALTSGASAQDIEERTIRWGHLNNTDHPVTISMDSSCA
jgi:TRAP-type transport system periplasmic protein